MWHDTPIVPSGRAGAPRPPPGHASRVTAYGISTFTLKNLCPEFVGACHAEWTILNHHLELSVEMVISLPNGLQRTKHIPPNRSRGDALRRVPQNRTRSRAQAPAVRHQPHIEAEIMLRTKSQSKCWHDTPIVPSGRAGAPRPPPGHASRVTAYGISTFTLKNLCPELVGDCHAESLSCETSVAILIHIHQVPVHCFAPTSSTNQHDRCNSKVIISV
jgi:hypothetical protein